MPTGQTLLLDVDTPILKMLLINGGAVLFDEKDIHLQAENVLITEGGLLQVINSLHIQLHFCNLLKKNYS